jgi:hypothetical protein
LGRVGIALAANLAAIHLGGVPRISDALEMTMTYVKPAVQRFGSLRELTLGGGPLEGGDATNLYHRS